MACFSPLSAWQTDGGAIVFAERGQIRRALMLPCGQCVGCRLERSRQWAVRCMHEASMFDMSSFVTLTYEDNPVSLCYRDYQLFMKRLRFSYSKARFFMCGEYGEELSRPHFHACLFGVHFPDRVVFSTGGSGSPCYTSKILEKLWPHGFSTVGDVTFESAAYCARYVMKKVTGPSADEHYERVSLSTGEIIPVRPEFCQMSRRPGIGATWFAKFKSDVFSHTKDGVYVFDQKGKPPRAYAKYLAASDPAVFESVEFNRYRSITADVVADATPERLAVREKVASARLAFKKRTL